MLQPEDQERERRERQHMHSSTTRGLHGTTAGRMRMSDSGAGAAATPAIDYGGRYSGMGHRRAPPQPPSRRN